LLKEEVQKREHDLKLKEEEIQSKRNSNLNGLYDMNNEIVVLVMPHRRSK
jgi:hypothetical protein